jgi:hypothetical protein
VFKIAQTVFPGAHSLLSEGHCWTEANMAHLQTDGAQVFALWHNEGMATYPKRPRDPAQLAKLMIDIASGDVDDSPKIIEPGKEYAQKGGLKGGPARAAKLGPKRRAEIAQKAAKARWANPRRKKTAPK